ncbi:hypothetical protein DL770_004056 [Monosporascus sp. CRB-9-2]|nr:hypothetical protein DL770_004056 [Monosporascus sp. CRB-9-2]
MEEPTNASAVSVCDTEQEALVALEASLDHTLDGHIADDQLTMLRYGTALAFMTKACLVSAVIVAYRQRIWMTVRSKMLSVAALDSLFAATEDLSALWNLEIYKRAKVAIALAFLVWLAPLVIILTSSTLGVEPAFTIDNTTCPGVRTLNFVMEELENWRDPTRIDGLYGLSVSLWNSTTETNTSAAWFDYYTGYSNQFEQIARMAVYGKQVVSRTGATMDICGAGWNCTYVVNFTAPGYQCKELAKGVGSRIERFRDHDPPEGFSTELLLPEGNYSYYAYTSGGDYAVSQMEEVNTGGMPPGGPPFPENLGAFRTEPILWIGYSEQVHPDRKPSRTEPGWNEAFVPRVFACENYETEYTIRFNHTGGEQLTNIMNRNFLHPVIDTKWLQDEDANDGTNDNTTAYPKSNYVYPNDDKQHYRRVAAFHSIGAMLRYFVNGTIDVNIIEKTKAIQTKLIDPRRGWFPHPDLMERVQSLYEDIIFSIFSNPQFLSVVWAARPDAISGDVAGDASTRYPCERSRFENHYRYHTGTLWGVYGGAMLLAALGIASGTRAVLENEGRLRDTRFSSIVAATRGPALEKVGWGYGDDPAADLPRDVKNLRVGYGLVHQGTTAAANANALGVSIAAANTPSPRPDDARFFPERVVWDGDVRYGFGLEGDVSQMRSEGSLFRGRSRA